MNVMIETGRPFGTDGTTYGYDRTVAQRPAVAELAAAGTGPSARRVTSRAHKADLTETQRAVLGLAVTGTYGRVHVGRYVRQNVTAATIRALANKGYGRALTAGTLGAGWSHRRRHEVIAFEINDLGRRALAELDAGRGQ